MLKKLPDWLIDLCKDIKSSGGRAFLVGGCVRDGLLGHLVKDYDIEVYGLPSAQVREILERHGKVNTVGEHFAVYKLRPSRKSDTEVDVSLPRRESKHGSGHRGFIVQGDPWLSFRKLQVDVILPLTPFCMIQLTEFLSILVMGYVISTTRNYGQSMQIHSKMTP